MSSPTGRLTSHNPNLQNIPVHTECGERIKAAFLRNDCKTCNGTGWGEQSPHSGVDVCTECGGCGHANCNCDEGEGDTQ